MKLNFGGRVILFLHWLISVVLLAAIVFADTTAMLIEKLRNAVNPNYVHIAFIAFAAIDLLLCIAAVCLIFKRDGKRSERGFITVDSSETGRVRIAISAIEQMVKQAVCAVDGISEMKIGISNMDDAIAINVNMTLVSGSHVPTVTLNMQRAIRQFVEMNCGVSVRTVSINIQAVSNAAETGRKGRRWELKQPDEQNIWQSAPEAVPVVPEETPLVQQSAAYEPAETESVPMEEHGFYAETAVTPDESSDIEAPSEELDNN